MVGFFDKNFGYYHRKFNSGNFPSGTVKLLKYLKLTFRSKFNHDYLQSAVWKALSNFNPIDDGVFFFEAAHGFGGGARKTSSLYLRYPTVMTLGTVVSYPKKIQKIYKSCDTQLNFCWHQHFLIENQQILLYQEIHV